MLNNIPYETKEELSNKLFTTFTLIEHAMCISDIMQNDYFLPSAPQPHLLAHYYEQNQILLHIIFDNVFRAKSGLKSLMDKLEN